MGVRQYVGARYTPKFYENSQNASLPTWEANTSYEALTIVTYNNSSYTSKIPVPATVGNPAQNPTYWALTGDYNAQVEAYREETVAVQESLNETNQNLANEIQERTNTDNSLQTQVTNLKFDDAGKYVIIGDSYATVAACGENNWANILAQRLGTDKCTISSQGGAGFVVPNNTFLQRLNAVADDTDVTAVIVCGGANDIAYAVGDEGASNIRTAISAFYARAKAKFPRCRVYIGFIGNVKPSFTVEHYGVYRINWLSVLYAYKTAYPYQTIYLNGIEYLNNNFDNLLDQTHPNEAQSIYLGNNIYNCLINGYVSDNGGGGQLSLTCTNTAQTVFSIGYYGIENKVHIGGSSQFSVKLDDVPENEFYGKYREVARFNETGKYFPTEEYTCLQPCVVNYTNGTSKTKFVLMKIEPSLSTSVPHTNMQLRGYDFENTEDTISEITFFDNQIYNGDAILW